MARITIDLPRVTEARLQALARASGQDLAAFLVRLAEAAADGEPPSEAETDPGGAVPRDADPWTALMERVRLTPERIAERRAHTIATLRPRMSPVDSTNGMHRVFGRWPGDETEEELLALERAIDDEDAGRIPGAS